MCPLMKYPALRIRWILVESPWEMDSITHIAEHLSRWLDVHPRVSPARFPSPKPKAPVVLSDQPAGS